MKLIELDDLTTAASPTIPVERIPSFERDDRPKRENLTARWDIEEGKLVCRWILQ